MFVGSFRIAVGSDGRLTLPAAFAAELIGQELVLECISGADGSPAIMAVPAQRMASRSKAADGRCAVGPRGEAAVDPGLLRRVCAGEHMDVEGMGEYLILRCAP